MQKFSSYGFKAYKDRDAAQDAILYREEHPDDFDANMALVNLGDTDSSYGMKYENRDRLERLNKKDKINDYIRSRKGYIEDRPGFTRKSDVYTDENAARDVAEYIRIHHPVNKEIYDSAIAKEMALSKALREATDEFVEKDKNLAQKQKEKLLDYTTSKNMTGIPEKLNGYKNLIGSEVVKAHRDVGKSIYERRRNRMMRNIGNVPDDVLYNRFADSIDSAVDDGNKLFNFRYY